MSLVKMPLKSLYAKTLQIYPWLKGYKDLWTPRVKKAIIICFSRRPLTLSTTIYIVLAIIL